MVASKFILTVAAALTAVLAMPLAGETTVDIILTTRQASLLPNGIESSMTNFQQVIDSLTRQLQSNDGKPVSDTISAVITGLDSQIDNAAGVISNALGPLTGGLSNVVGNFLLGPLFQSVTNGAEVVLSNVLGGAVDAVIGAPLEQLTNSITGLIQTGSKYGIDTSKLSSINSQLQQTLSQSN